MSDLGFLQICTLGLLGTLPPRRVRAEGYGVYTHGWRVLDLILTDAPVVVGV